jgi:hypothetical protein
MRQGESGIHQAISWLAASPDEDNPVQEIMRIHENRNETLGRAQALPMSIS